MLLKPGWVHCYYMKHVILLSNKYVSSIHEVMSYSKLNNLNHSDLNVTKIN